MGTPICATSPVGILVGGLVGSKNSDSGLKVGDRRTIRWWLVFALVFVVIALAFSIRYLRIDAGLPYTPHWDEAYSADNALRMLSTGDLNPHFFNYPSFLTYMCLAVDLGHYFYLMGQAPTEPEYLNSLKEVEFGLDYEKRTFATTFSSPSFYRWNRLAVVILGVLTVGLIMLVAQTAFDTKVAILAGGLLAGMEVPVANSVTITPNGPFTFWIAAALLYSLLYTARRRFRYIVLALVCAGIATGTKYNACVSIAIPLAAYVLFTPRSKLFGAWKYRFLAFLGIPPIAFLVCCPYALLDLSTFAAHVGYEIRHYKVVGHGGDATSEPGFPHFIFQMNALNQYAGWWAYLSACVGISVVCFRRPRLAAVLLSFPVIYMYVMCNQKVNFHRNFLPVYLYLALFAAVFWVSMAEALTHLMKSRKKLARYATPASALSLIFCAVPLMLDLDRELDASVRIHGAKDTRTQALQAINELCSQGGEDTPCRVVIAEELKTSSYDLHGLNAEYSVTPAVLLPSSIHVFDFIVTAEKFENQLLPSIADFDAQSVETIQTFDRVAGECNAMPRSIRLNPYGPCFENPSVVILRSRARPVLGEELIVNGGLEGEYREVTYDNGPRGVLPVVGGWRITRSSDPSMRAAREASDANSGQTSLRLTRRPSVTGAAHLQCVFRERIEANSWYRLSFAMKTLADAGPTRIRLSRHDRSKGYDVYNAAADARDQIHVPSDPEWRTYAFQFRDTVGADKLLIEWSYFKGGDVLLDDVSLRKLSVESVPGQQSEVLTQNVAAPRRQ